MLPNKYAMDLSEINIKYKKVGLCIFITKLMNYDMHGKNTFFVTVEQELRRNQRKGEV